MIYSGNFAMASAQHRRLEVVNSMRWRPLKRAIGPVVVAISLAFFSTGCANTPKATSLSIGGALAGAAIGANRGGIAGALVGAAIGGFIGNQLGAHFDEEDKKKLALLELNVLQTGKSATFITNKSKATVTLTTNPSTIETVRTYKVSSDIKSYPLLIVSLSETRAFIDTPVFTNNNEKSEPKYIIRKGDAIAVAAHLQGDKQWGAIVAGEDVIGYVPLRYLDSKVAKKEKAGTAKIVAVKPAKALPNTLSKEIQQVTLPATSVAASPIAKPLDSSIRTVQALGACRTIVRKVDPIGGGDSFMEPIKYCQEPPPKWKVIQV